MKVETVKIKSSNSDGYIVINKSDMQKGDIVFKETVRKKAGKK